MFVHKKLQLCNTYGLRIYVGQSIQLERLHFLIDPVTEECHIRVNSRDLILPTADAPGDYSNLVVTVGGSRYRAHQRRAPISLARVLARLSPSAHKAVVQLKELA